MSIEQMMHRLPPAVAFVAMALLAGSPIAARPRLHAASTSHGFSVSVTQVHSFSGQPTDGRGPLGGLAAGANGVLYGTTFYGGTLRHHPCGIGCGTVFSLTPPAPGKTQWTETVLHSFAGGPNDGQFPTGTLLADGKGDLFGTTASGGDTAFCAPSGCGTVFELSPPARGKARWTMTILYSFRGAPNDGEGPGVDLVTDASGALYGTTGTGGGSTACIFSTQGCGTVFELTPPARGGTAWSEQVLHSFAGGPSDGAQPGTLIAHDGMLYGVTEYGGASTQCPYVFGCGSVYLLSPPKPGSTQWSEEILHSFNVLGGTSAPDGSLPGPLMVDGAGALYGMTAYGGARGRSGLCNVERGIDGCGTFYAMSPPKAGGTLWDEAIFYSFAGLPSDGAQPSGMIAGANGVFYGTAADAGSGTCSYKNGCGTFFQLTPSGSHWTETILHNFSNAPNDGNAPSGRLVSAHGAIFGTTYFGGSGACSFGCGAVYEVRP